VSAAERLLRSQAHTTMSQNPLPHDVVADIGEGGDALGLAM
jgi:hypothetical protein